MEFKPRKLSEATLQAEFYHQCRLQGIECFLEYRAFWNGKSGSRFDAVIIKDNQIKAIVELKSRKNLEKAKIWREKKRGMRE